MGHAASQELFTYQLKLWATAAIAIVASACSPATVQVIMSPDFHKQSIPPVAILPFQLDSPEDSHGQFPLSNSDVAPTATTTLTELFYKNLSKKSHLSVIPVDEIETAVSDFTIPPLDKDPSYAIARKIGKAIEAKTVLVGSVSQYRNRVGNALGIKQPATVGFEARLVNVLDGKTLWTGHFFETQRPMTSDLQGFLQRRRWLTARELAADGVKQVLDQWRE